MYILDRFWMWLAWRLPKRLVYQCANRVGAHTSTGKLAHKPYPNITFFEVMETWIEEYPPFTKSDKPEKPPIRP